MIQTKVLKHVINELSSELADAECSGIASGSASCGGKHFGGVTVGCICGGKHLGGVIGDSVGGNGDLMLWPFLAATGCASATSFLNRPMLLFKSFLACSNSRACASKSSWYFSNCIHRNFLFRRPFVCPSLMRI